MESHTAEVIVGPMSSTGIIDLRSAAEAYLSAVELWCGLLRLAGPAVVEDVQQVLAGAPRLRIYGVVATTVTWLEPVLEFGVVPRTVTVLQGITTVFQHIMQRGGGGDRGAVPPEARQAGAPAALSAAAPMADALEVLEMCVVAATGTACPAGADAGAVQRLRLAVLKQLAADETVRAVARSPGFVQQHLWPSLGSVGHWGRDGSDGSGTGHDAVPSSPPREHPQRPLSSRDRVDWFGVKAIFSTSSSSTPHAGFFCGCALGSAAAFVPAILGAAQTAPSVESAMFFVAAETQRVAERFLESLAELGLMSDLSSALLAAPPWPDVPPGAEVVHDYTKAIAGAQFKTLSAIFALVHCGNRAYLELLFPPEVQKLQWTLLEQVAATAEDVAAAAAAGAARESTGGGGSAAAVKQRWPLLQRQALRLLFGTNMQINEVMYKCIAATTGPAACIKKSSDVNDVIAYAEDLFPTRGSAAALVARVCAAVHARLHSLGAAGAQPRPGARVTPQDLVAAAGELQVMLLVRVTHAATEEQVACLPDLLTMLAWGLAIWTTPAGLQVVSVERVAESAKAMSAVLQGSMFTTDISFILRGHSTTAPERPAFLWRRLNPGARAACLQRLLPTNLPRVLDQLLRVVAAADKADSVLRPATVVHASLAELIGPLLRMRLVRWRVQQQVQQQTQTQQEGQQRPGVSSGSSSAAAPAGSPGGGGWRAEEELGLVLTALKLLRREAVPSSVQGAAAPGLLCSGGSAHFALACCVLQLGGADYGLPALLPELLKATPRGSSGRVAAAGEESGVLGPGTVDVVMVAQAVAACGWEGLRHLTPLLEQIADGGSGGEVAASRQPQHPAAAKLNESSELCDYGLRMLAAAEAVALAVRHSPVEVQLQAQPQRALAAIGRMLVFFREQQSAALRQQIVDTTLGWLRKAVALLSAEERLLSGCVPGWLWADWGAPPGRSGSGGGRGGGGLGEGGADPQPGWVLNEAALAGLHGSAGCVPQEGPVLVLRLVGEAIRQVGARRWVDHRRHVAMVAALAQETLRQLGLTDGRAWQLAAEAGGGGGGCRVELWPPRLLRLCGNPRCANFGGASESELELKKCSGCGAVRYCGRACQLQHWRTGHRQECEQQQAAAAVGGE